MVLQVVAKRGVSKRAVALANQKFGRIPAVVAADVSGNKLCKRLHVLVHAPEILVLCFPHGMAESGAHRIGKYEIRFVQQATGVIHQFVGRRRCHIRVDGHHPPRPDRSHVQPHRGRAGSAVVEKRDRPLAHVLDIAARIRRGINQRRGLVLLVLDENGRRCRLVGNGLTADFYRVICY